MPQHTGWSFLATDRETGKERTLPTEKALEIYRGFFSKVPAEDWLPPVRKQLSKDEKKSTQKKLRKQSLESTESEIVCVLTNQSKNPCNLQHLNTQKGIISVRGKLARLKGCSGHA